MIHSSPSRRSVGIGTGSSGTGRYGRGPSTAQHTTSTATIVPVDRLAGPTSRDEPGLLPLSQSTPRVVAVPSDQPNQLIEDPTLPSPVSPRIGTRLDPRHCPPLAHRQLIPKA